MEGLAQTARHACAAAMTVTGAIVLGSICFGSALLAHMEQSAMATERDPLHGVDAEGNSVSSASEQEASSVNWDYWRTVNGDVVAWICIPGTNVNHPLVQARSNDPQFYLTHDVYGNLNMCGCPYIDADCADGLDSGNVVVYGHNMGDESMFGQLVEYRDDQWAQEHHDVFVLTPEGTRHLEARGCAVVPGTTERKRCVFDSREDLGRYADAKLGNCQTVISEERGNWERLFTLCTCSYFDAPANERTLVYAFEETERS